MTDVVVKGGLVVDGTGGAGRHADVAIADGHVEAIGNDLRGDVELDASGCVVAPGFIDIHTHYDAQVFWDPAITPSCFHGVTTVVAGNCGFSIAPTRPEHRDLILRTLENVEDMNVASLQAGIPWEFESFPEYLDTVERRGSGLNFAGLVGHTAIRVFVMGDDAYERVATPDERGRMCAVLAEALEAGAAGFATSVAVTHLGDGGRPIPTRVADEAEFDALFDTVRRVQHGIVELTVGPPISPRRAVDVQRRAGVPLTYAALLTLPERDRVRRQLEQTTEAAEAGVDIWPQVSPRPLVFELLMTAPFTLNTNAVFAELMAGSVDDRRRAYADPEFRRRAREDWGRGGMPPRWDTFEIAESTAHPEAVGMRLTDLGGDPLDTLLDLAVDEPGVALRVRCVRANDDPEMLPEILRHPHCTLGLSDAGAHVSQLCDAPQATDFLGNWVRDRDLMPIEDAIRKLTSVQAGILGIPDRGTLEPGKWADVVVFDFERIAPGPVRRVRDFPADAERLTADQPSGIRHVLVNGTPIVRDEAHDASARPGRLLRSVRRSATV